jgi:hypothetical protein
MVFWPQHSTAARPRSRAVLLVLLCLVSISNACSTKPPVGKVYFEDPRGTVFLQVISDQSVQASHPINLDQGLIARVLSGLHVQERQRALQELLAGSASAAPVFSEEQVQFLAPRIAKALTAATAGEAVAFRVTSPRSGTSRLESSVTETTAGSLYAYGLSLYVTLSQYRYAPGQPNADGSAHRRLPDSSGLSNRTLYFTPSAAQRPEGFYRPAGGASTDRALAIDYQLLQQASLSGAVAEQTVPLVERMAAPVREPLPGTRLSDASPQIMETLAQREAEIHTLKDLVVKKDLELEAIRNELQSLRQELHDRTTRQESQKRRNKSPSKPQQAAP